MAMLYPDDPKGVDLEALLDRAKQEGLRERFRQEAQRERAKRPVPHGLEDDACEIDTVCSQQELRGLIQQYQMVRGGKGLLQALADSGGLFDTDSRPEQYEAAPESPWIARLRAIREFSFRTRKAQFNAPHLDKRLASARRAIYLLAASGESPYVRIAAVRHLSKTFSKEKQSALKYGLKSLDSGDRAASEALLSKFDRTECTYDQGFLTETACNADCAKDRITALEQLLDEAVVATVAICDSNVFGRVAETALALLTDQKLIAKVARRAASLTVRCKAVDLIDDQKVLKRLARRSPEVGIRLTATRKLSSPQTLAKVGLRDPDPDVREAAIDRVDDPKRLRKAALCDDDPRVRRSALRRISDSRVLARVAAQDDDPEVRLLALAGVTDQSILANIALNDSDFKVRAEAVRYLTNQDVLSQVASNDKRLDVRRTAARVLGDQELQQQVLGLIEKARAEKKAQVFRLAMAYLRSLPLENTESLGGAQTGTAQDVVDVLKSNGTFDYVEDEGETAEDVWRNIMPSHVDALTGNHTSRALFLIDIEFYQSGSEHFKRVTYLEVIRIGDDSFSWLESSGTYDG